MLEKSCEVLGLTGDEAYSFWAVILSQEKHSKKTSFCRYSGEEGSYIDWGSVC